MSGIELSIVIPVFNNASTLDELIALIETAALKVAGKTEIIFVDDGSSDGSWQKIQSTTSSIVRGVRLSRNFGQHAALKAGFAEADGNYVVMMDADLEEDPTLIPSILNALIGGHDICYTVYPEAMKNNTRRTSRIFHRFVSSVSKTDRTANIATMRGFNRKVLDAILRHGERRPVYGPLIVGLGFTATEITVDLPPNKGQDSRYNFVKRVRLALDYMVGYTNLPALFFMTASGVSFFATTAYTAIILFQYLVAGNQLPPGISLLMVVMLLLFSMLFFGIGIVGLYLHRLLEESLGRPLYLIADRHTSTDELAINDKQGKYLDVRRD